MKKHALLAALLLGSAVRAEDRSVQVFDGAFLPPAFSINVGDAVTWVWRGEGVQRVVVRDEQGEQVLEMVLDEQHPTFTRLFEAPGTYSYSDDEHGAFGTLAVVPWELKVEVVDLAFTPEVAVIFEGDAINWIWIEGEHTITSGTGSKDPEMGKLFNVPSTAALTSFTYAFNASGLYDYFCIPHEEMRMFGKVQVQKRFVRGDLGGNGDLDISDAILILGSLFLGTEARPCADAADSNDDGTVDVSDGVFVLEFLFLGGRTIPPPYPRMGADRTDDTLECW